MTVYEVGGIAGGFNLALDCKEPERVHLSRQISLTCKGLGGKAVGEEQVKGFIQKLSRKSAEIRFTEPVALFTDLKMNVTDVPRNLADIDFYGKVVAALPENCLTCIVRFTAIPPEISSYFQAFLQLSET